MILNLGCNLNKMDDQTVKHRKISKRNFSTLFRKVREFWNEYDPIGVMVDPEWPRDEYDTYAMRTLSLLNERATIEEHCAHLKDCHKRMGVEFVQEPATDFVKELRRWWFNHMDGDWHH